MNRIDPCFYVPIIFAQRKEIFKLRKPLKKIVDLKRAQVMKMSEQEAKAKLIEFRFDAGAALYL